MDGFAFVALAAAVLFLAGFVKGVIGLGLPTIGVGLLGFVMAPVAAAALMVVPNVVTNVAQAWAGPHRAALVRRLWPMLAALVAGILAASSVGGVGGRWSVALLGAAILAYAGLGLAQVRLSVPARHEPWLGPVAGLATGVLTAVTGVFVIPAVPYLQALGLEKDELVQALGLFFLTATIALAVALGAQGLLDAHAMLWSALALLPAGAGMLAGQWLRGRISAQAFRRAFFIGLAALGILLLGRSLA